jgi:hypothetical protein
VVQWPGDLPDALTVAKVGSVVESGAVGYTLSSKVTRIGLQAVSGQEKTAPSSMDDVRKATVFAQSETIPLAPLPIEDPVAGTRIDLETWVDGLTEGQSIIVCGELALSAGNEACEFATIAAVRTPWADGYSRIILATALRQAAARVGVTIYATRRHGGNRKPVTAAASQPPLPALRSTSFPIDPCQLAVPKRDRVYARSAGQRPHRHEVPSFVGTWPTDRAHDPAW